MQVSGLIDTRHRNPSSSQPMYRPSQNCTVSPSSKAVTAANSTYGPHSVCAPTAAPAATRAIAAGKGRPIASASNSPKVRAYPWRTMSKCKSIKRLDKENQETVQYSKARKLRDKRRQKKCGAESAPRTSAVGNYLPMESLLIEPPLTILTLMMWMEFL